MYERISRTQVERAFARMTKSAARVGIAPPEGLKWGLDWGSQKYGRAHRMFWLTENYTCKQPGHLNDFLGTSYGEALHTLRTLADAFDALADKEHAALCQEAQQEQTNPPWRNLSLVFLGVVLLTILAR